MTNDLLVFLLNAAWQTVVFLVFGAIAARLLRRGPVTFEYFVSTAVLVVASLAPWLSLIALRNSAGALHHWAWQSGPATAFGLWISGSSYDSHVGIATPHGSWHMLSLMIAWVYGLFVAIQCSRLIYGWRQVRRMVDTSSACHGERVLRVASEVRRGHKAQAEVRISDTARMPFTVGFFAPVVVLPHFLLSDSDEVLSLVLAHEFAHVRRCDWVMNFALLLISLPLSFHPCIALMRKKVETAREVACDEMASGCLASASVYARVLLDLAGKLAQRQPSLAAAYKGAALGVLDGSTLGDRIRRLMDRSARLSTRQTRLILTGCSGILLVTCVAVTGVALALPSHQPGGNSPKTYAWTRDGSVAGVWQGQFTDYHTGTGKIGHTPIYLQLQENGGTFSGVIGPDASGAVPLQRAQLDGNRLHLTTTIKRGDESVSWKLDFTVNGDQMSGTGHALRSDQHTWDVEANLTRKQ
jgi:beta-lactamase regulating signal transducer with metallopeptidase domain